MEFPNAKKGIGMLVVSEIMTLVYVGIGLLFSMVMVGVSLVISEVQASTAASGIVSWVQMIMTVVMAAIILGAYVVRVIGVVHCSRDEPLFKTTLYVIAVGFAATVLELIFSENVAVSSACSMVSNITDLCIAIFIIQGVRNIGAQLGNAEIEKRGKYLVTIAIIAYSMIILANAVGTIMNNNVGAVIANAIEIGAGILEIVQYVLFLIYILKAKKMLNN